MIAVYRFHDDAEIAVKTLRESKFGTDSVSIVGRNFHTLATVVGYYATDDVVRPCGRFGPFWGDLLRLFSESGLFWVPDFGPLVMAGELISRVRQASEESVIVYGLTALGVALYSMSVPEQSILGYEEAIKRDHFVLIVQGGDVDVTRARDVLVDHDVESMEVYPSSMKTAV
jgi:hypothetical protein